jgi:hypothetical protein
MCSQDIYSAEVPSPGITPETVRHRLAALGFDKSTYTYSEPYNGFVRVCDDIRIVITVNATTTDDQITNILVRDIKTNHPSGITKY